MGGIDERGEGLPDVRLAHIAFNEKRVLVTNDSDFADPIFYTCDDLYALIWLQVRQSNFRIQM